MTATKRVVFATFALTLFSASLSPIASAQENPTTQLLRSKTLLEAFDHAYYRHDRDFYSDVSIKRQIGQFFNFLPPELEIAWDAKRVNSLYKDAVRQQTMGDPYVRVKDLTNPFCQTLQGTPQACGNVQANPLPAAFQPMLPPPVATPPVQSSPTPALF